MPPERNVPPDPEPPDPEPPTESAPAEPGPPAPERAPAGRPLRASDLLGRAARDAEGRHLGRVVDLRAEPGDDGRPYVNAVVVVRGPWGRLLGYEREQVRGPWLLEILARAVLRRSTRTVPWRDLHLD
ncbi:hypothetical protein AB0J86_29655 [Micromonospora sp. NPDC049559]|uniref:PRC-barrel domain-containing protein n=1 Tax=Micromonospora sp. NPDC049559 TaxID=3155923 RepID=UPI003434E69C